MRFIYAFTPRDYVLINGEKTYLWNIAKAFDGLLLSRAYVNGKLERAMKDAGSVKKYFKIPENVEVVSDSGAFTWKHYDKPPIKPIELLRYYHENGFDAGVHPDHICRPMKFTVSENGEKKRYEITPEDAKERFRISLELAEETARFLDENSTYKGVKIYGVAQGWNPETYLDCVKELLKMGYKYIALGGLALATTAEVTRTLKVAMNYINTYRSEHKEKIEIHLLGVGRPSLLPLMEELKVSSFDTAAWLRSAWIRGVWLYHNRATGQLLSLDVKLFDPHKHEYRRDPPLPRCDCPVCRDVGVDEDGVVWTRRYYGNQRNMSRGFHNLCVFYEWFKAGNHLKNFQPLNGRVLVATHCAEKKRGVKEAAPPQELYISLRIRKVYEVARRCRATFAVVSAKYGLVLEDERITPYDQTIKSGHDIDRLVKLISTKLMEKGPWDWLIYFGSSRKYITAFFSAAVAAGYGDKTIVLGRNTLGELDKLERILIRLGNHLLDEYF